MLKVLNETIVLLVLTMQVHGLQDQIHTLRSTFAQGGHPRP